ASRKVERKENAFSTVLRLRKAHFRSFRFQLRKQNDVPNAFLADQHHAKPVNAHAHAAGGWHAGFWPDEEILIKLLLLTASLMFKAFALLNRIILLGISRRDFLAIDAAFENLNRRRVLGR